MPFLCDTVPTYDHLLKDLHVPSIDKAWALVNQKLLDIFLAKKKRKFTGIRYLNQNLVPCCPGSVLLVRERSFQQWILRKDKYAIFCGQLPDFYDQRMMRRSRDVRCLRQEKPKRQHDGRVRMVFRSTNGRKEVKVDLWNLDINTLEQICSKNTWLDLDNFAHTGFCDDFLYLVTHTVTVERIRIKVAVNGKTTVFDERVSRTVGFACDEIRLSQSGTIKMLQPVLSRLPIKIFPRSVYETLINNLLPNQSRFGGGVGDTSSPPTEDPSTFRLRQLQRMRQIILDRQNLVREAHRNNEIILDRQNMIREAHPNNELAAFNQIFRYSASASELYIN